MTSCFAGSQEKLFLFRTWALANELKSCALKAGPVAGCQCTEATESCREVEMKLLLALACFCFAMSYSAHSASAPQTFPTSAGEVKITPLYHASSLIEAGGKNHLPRPGQTCKIHGVPKSGPHPYYPHSPGSHGSGFHRRNQQARDGNSGAARRGGRGQDGQPNVKRGIQKEME